jgi:hypothetical protein
LKGSSWLWPPAEIIEHFIDLGTPDPAQSLVQDRFGG